MGDTTLWDGANGERKGSSPIAASDPQDVRERGQDEGGEDRYGVGAGVTAHCDSEIANALQEEQCDVKSEAKLKVPC